MLRPSKSKGSQRTETFVHFQVFAAAARGCACMRVYACVHHGLCVCFALQAMTWLDEAPSKEAKVALLVALRDITDGKIFVEAERAKLTRLLAAVCMYFFYAQGTFYIPPAPLGQTR